MQNFVHAQNLGHYVELLDTVTDPALRDQVQSLLIEEENRFGSRRERLDQANDLIRRAHLRLESQESLMAKLAALGQPSEAAERLHENTRSTLELFLKYRRGLLEALDGSDL